MKRWDRPSWDSYWMHIANLASTRATCPRKQVGSVIVMNKIVISTGYNGAVSGEPHCIDVGCEIVDNHCIKAVHSEENAINQAYPLNIKGSTLYCTLQPCLNCSHLITKAGIIEVVYNEPYGKTLEEMMNIFQTEGIKCRQFIKEVV